MDEVEDSTMTTTASPLSSIVEAFEDLARFLNSCGKTNDEEEEEEELRLDTLCDACSLVSVLFGCLGLAFKFAELEYVAKLGLNEEVFRAAQIDLCRICYPFDSYATYQAIKVRNLVEASKTYDTLHNILDSDVENDTVKTSGSYSRNLRRVRQGLDLIRALFENFLSTEYYSLKDAASTAYAQVCAPYHTWAVRTAVYAGMYALPTREQLLLKLNETDQSAEKKMRRYIEASVPVIEYIDKLYISRNITLDW